MASQKPSIFSHNAILPDLDQSFDFAERLSVKFHSDSLQYQNENVEQINDVGIAQVHHLSQEGSVWKMCKEGLLQQLKHKFEVELVQNNSTFDVVKERGTFGETILHVSILFKQINVAKYLIKEYPILVNQCYLNEEYYGENALHMSVINRDYELTEYLLKHGANPNLGKATGRFFDKEQGTVYYGEHAITFAISTFQSNMIELLSEYGAKLNVCDCFGNSVFHHCVRVNSPDVLDTLIRLSKSEKKGFDMSSLNQIKNDCGFSVLQYAVKLGKKEIFDYMIEQMKIVCWEWGDVAFYAYPITEIDTHGDNTHSVLETIITEHHNSFILNPVIYEVLLEKWKSYGQTLFTLWFVLHLLYCIVVTMTCLQFPFELSNKVFEYTLWIQGCVLVICCKVLTMTMMELFELNGLIQEHGWKRGWHIYFEKGNTSLGSILSVTGIFKIIAWSGNILSLSCVVCLIIAPDHSNLLRNLMVFVMLCEWLHGLMFLQAFKSTGRLVVTISKILAKDVSRFVFIYFIILCAFSSSLALLTRGSGNDWMGSMFIMFEISLGMGSFFGKTMTNPFDLVVSQILYVIFLLLSVVLLFNLLIAIMTETTEEVRQQAIEQWLLQWASSVLLIERRVPKCLYKRTGNAGIKFGFNQKNQHNEYFITFTQTKQFRENNVIKTFRQSTFVSQLE
eukprot:19038_1